MWQRSRDSRAQARFEVRWSKVGVRCSVSGREWKNDLAGRHVIEHAQRSFLLGVGAPPEKTLPDPAVYESDAPYPSQRYDVVGIQKKRGVSILLINLYPVEYRPKSGRLAWYESLHVSVTTRA